MESSLYQVLIQQIVDEAAQQDDILGILLIGSVARGDALPGSDLDLRFILTEGRNQAFQSEIRDGIMVERGYADLPLALAKLDTNQMEIYAYLDGRILFDAVGVFEQLMSRARLRFLTYQVSAHEHREIKYWLQSVRLKLRAALQADDMLKAAYLMSTSSWQILRGLWAANEKPMPPNGAVWAHLKDLSRGPEHIEEHLSQMFCAEPRQQAQIALELLDWILDHLNTNGAA